MAEEIWNVSSAAAVPFTKIYMDDEQAEHIARGHREFANVHLPIKEAAENPTHVYESKASHSSDAAHKRLQFVSDNVRNSSGKRTIMVVVEREDGGAGKIVTATWKGSITGTVFWEAESNVFTHLDRGADIAYVSRGQPREAYSDEDPSEPSIWLRRADEDDAPVGVTVMEFSRYWGERREDLVQRVSTFLSLPQDDVRLRLNGLE